MGHHLQPAARLPLPDGGRHLFCYLPGEETGEDEQVFLKAVADQTAVAIENARLFSEARGKAALEERQRLARELHDSVSQALYGIALGARTARKLAGPEPPTRRRPPRLRPLFSRRWSGRDAGADLRAQAGVLESEGLVAALEKQAAALRARHEIEVEVALCDEPEASLEVKEALYRIAQEALHNTVRHARANNVTIKMVCEGGLLTLEVSDDGVGFDPGGEFPGHLGLRSMRERAQRLGGTLTVESDRGRDHGPRSRPSPACRHRRVERSFVWRARPSSCLFAGSRTPLLPCLVASRIYDDPFGEQRRVTDPVERSIRIRLRCRITWTRVVYTLKGFKSPQGFPYPPPVW